MKTLEFQCGCGKEYYEPQGYTRYFIPRVFCRHVLPTMTPGISEHELVPLYPRGYKPIWRLPLISRVPFRHVIGADQGIEMVHSWQWWINCSLSPIQITLVFIGVKITFLRQ